MKIIKNSYIYYYVSPLTFSLRTSLKHTPSLTIIARIVYSKDMYGNIRKFLKVLQVIYGNERCECIRVYLRVIHEKIKDLPFIYMDIYVFMVVFTQTGYPLIEPLIEIFANHQSIELTRTFDEV